MPRDTTPPRMPRLAIIMRIEPAPGQTSFRWSLRTDFSENDRLGYSPTIREAMRQMLDLIGE